MTTCPPTLHWRRAVSFFLVHSTGWIRVRYVDRGRSASWTGELLGLDPRGPLVRMNGQPRVLCDWDDIRHVRPAGAVVVRGEER